MRTRGGRHSGNIATGGNARQERGLGKGMKWWLVLGRRWRDWGRGSRGEGRRWRDGGGGGFFLTASGTRAGRDSQAGAQNRGRGHGAVVDALRPPLRISRDLENGF
jgi:hypothetical protein